jgi:DNA-binding transcriptional LysR family regulator
MSKIEPSFTELRVEDTGGFDFNLLRSLAVLLEESSVTRAADRLNVSQPAMSRTLGRLRAFLGDKLLERTGRGMELTPRAEAIRTPVRRLVADVQMLVHTEPLYQPSLAEDRFVLAVDPSALVTLVPEIVRAVGVVAPGVELRVQTLVGTVETALLCGDVDLVIGPTQAAEDGALRRRNLVEDSYVCLVRRRHPALDAGGRLADLREVKRARVASAGAWGGEVEAALCDAGQAGRVRMVLPDLLAVPQVIARTDLVLVLPRGVAQSLARADDLLLVEPPCVLPPFRLAAFWRSEQQANLGHRWLRRLVAEAAVVH